VTTLRALAPGKVNLALFLGPVRPTDGRHELVTLIESVSLADEVTLSVSGERSDIVSCPGVEGPNLAAAALELLRDAGWGAPPVAIEIVKRVPVAAGMGGGSGDAAAALRLAAALEPLPDGLDLHAAAFLLGADVPSQLEPGAWLGMGAGESISAAARVAAHELVIVPLPYGLSTPDVFREADRLELPRADAELAVIRAQLSAMPPGNPLPDSLLVNDLQPAAISLCPEVEGALDAVLAAGADHALVSGSGPTVFGIFWGADGRAQTAAAALSASFPGTTAAAPVDVSAGAVRRLA
jgi:4-diphosphocytidyl-2-C-methyl-D-erythritol kinase